MAILYMLVGVPASGKSTWTAAQKKLNSERENELICISRDKIRFSKLKDTDKYFVHEREVFQEYVKQIQEGLDSGHNVIADATQLNEISRNKLLNRLNLDNVQICPVVFKVNLDTCLERNALRTGRAKVPESVLMDMYDEFEVPSYSEKYTYSNIIIVTDETYNSI